MKVLIVDDDARNIFALTATLKAKGFTCASCGSAVDALTLLNTDPGFDAILLDMMMPELDGYEAIPRIRQLDGYGQVPIVAVTAQAMTGDREKCLQAGATDYVSKPINVDQLLAVLNRQA